MVAVPFGGYETAERKLLALCRKEAGECMSSASEDVTSGVSALHVGARGCSPVLVPAREYRCRGCLCLGAEGFSCRSIPRISQPVLDVSTSSSVVVVRDAVVSMYSYIIYK